MNYKFNWNDGNVFAVPDNVTGSGFKLASGKWVKVLIYMLSKKDLPDDPAEIGVSSEDIEEALAYWLEQGIIFPSSSPSHPKAPAEPKPAITILAPAPQEIQTAPAKKHERPSAAKAMLPSEIAERIAASEEIAFLMSSAEGIMKKPLNFEEQRTILSFVDYYGLSVDVILMLMGFCSNMGKINIAYIERVAEDWFEKEITTHEQAEKEILNMQKLFSFEGKIQSRLSLPDKLTKAQRDFIAQWSVWDISLEMIELAYEKTLNQKGKIDFRYMNGIIKKWYENGIVDAAAAESYDSRPKKQTVKAVTQSSAPTAKAAPSFDLQQILEHAKNTTPKL